MENQPYLLEVRFNECDMYGHVNHSVYLSYLETARIAILKEKGYPIDRISADGFRLFVTKIEIEYLSAAKLHDKLEIYTLFKSKGRVRGLFVQEIKKEGVLVVKANIHWACMDDKEVPSRIPEKLRSLIFNQ